MSLDVVLYFSSHILRLSGMDEFLYHGESESERVEKKRKKSKVVPVKLNSSLYPTRANRKILK